jgi:hypothetical protein
MWMRIRKHAKWRRYIVLKGINKLEEYDKKPQHSKKEPDKGMSK